MFLLYPRFCAYFSLQTSKKMINIWPYLKFLLPHRLCWAGYGSAHTYCFSRILFVIFYPVADPEILARGQGGGAPGRWRQWVPEARRLGEAETPESNDF